MERNLRLNWPDIVQNAVAVRKQNGFTQEQLALLADVSKPTLNHFEQGRTTVTLKNALKILSALGLA